MKGFMHRKIVTSWALVIVLLPAAAFAQVFTYLQPGDLIPRSGENGTSVGAVDYTVYVAGMRFPVEAAPAYANSQVFGVGGSNGPSGSQCDPLNYSYPWRDNFCENRWGKWTTPACPENGGHQGQDIRPSTCSDATYWAVAAEDGRITSIGNWSLTLTGDNGAKHRYLHLDHSTLVVGHEAVKRGQRIGKVSNVMPPHGTTIHLHYEIRDNSAVYPPYMTLVRAYESLVGAGARRAAVAGGVDFDGNGLDDIFWYGPGVSASDHVWYSQGRNNFSSVPITIIGAYVPIAGDFDGDGKGDIFWYAAGDAADWIYYGAGYNAFEPVSTPVYGTYLPISGDFNGDGATDVFWYGPGADPDRIWWSEGRRDGTRFRSVPTPVSGTYVPISGDFDGDGRDDVFWYGPGADPDRIWWSLGETFSSDPSVTVSGTYTPISEDFNGDGRTDIFWYGPGSGSDSIWLFTGARTGVPYHSYRTRVSGTYLPLKGDFDGDGFGDIFWYAAGSNSDWIWFGTATGYSFQGEGTAVYGTYIPIP